MNGNEEIPELNKKYDYGGVDAKIELKAAFLGQEDEMILAYLKKVPNPRGIVLANLILYFCYKYGLMGERRLMRRLSHLLKMELISTSEESGLRFYKLVTKPAYVKKADR